MNSAPTKVPVLKGLQNAMNDAWQKFFTSLVSAITTLENKTPLVYETTVSGGAVTSIDITGLDINTHKSYIVEFESANNSGATFDLSIYFNNDTTATNYYSQTRNSDNATYYSARANTAVIAQAAGGVVAARIIVQRTADGYCLAKHHGHYSTGAAIRLMDHVVSKTATLSNLTQITLTSSVASAMNNSTTVRVYRGDI